MAEEKNILEETTTTESVTPIELVKPAYEDDWAERRLQDMYNKDQEQRAAIAQDKIDRERLGRSLGELGRTFSDMILAAGGAPVSPRDVSRVYADLDARNQRLFETEQARRYQQQQNELAMMRQERERRNQRAQHQADLENAQKFQAEQARLARDERKEIQAAHDKAKVEAARIAANARISSSYAPKKGGSGGSQETGKSIIFGNGKYTIPKDSIEAATGALYEYLLKNGLLNENYENLKSQNGALTAVVANLLYLEATEHGDNIRDILKTYGTETRINNTATQTSNPASKTGGAY